MFLDRRLFWSRAFLGMVFLVAIAVDSPFSPRSIDEPYILSDLLSLVLVTVAAFGRIWTSLYIGGNKNIVLVQDGPYSICRNPLYFFSALGGIGIAIQSFEILVAVGIAMFFVGMYPRTVRQEERHLEATFGERFRAYRKTTPAFFPRLSLYRTSEKLIISPKYALRAFADGIWWIIVWYLVGSVEKLEMLKVIKPVISLPWWR